MADRATFTIYFPQKHQDQDVLGRLQKLAKEKDRSVNDRACLRSTNLLDHKC